ncbi:hypothetical protein [Nostoc sp. 'Peltigera malacea cyanobiont' DB3992]|uniref:hypothetical protein n=1 Tax=Nostoc sp. 'Peltigera malacea cyanobiont' DB3992 TaxID=1206980 RepID=UPI000C03E2B1|nr:hypothetical protein [Nostoc sp. 'Peltigera malacea cyanobiont' DB3992]PHM05813.1 hypothetical protein CK516_38180 [Nostoc sp. 'Peltigera malacea cyanobiont' DB3992]
MGKFDGVGVGDKPPTLGITTANQPLEEVRQTPEVTDATTTNQTTLKVSQTAEVRNSTTAKQTTPELSSPWTNLKPPAMSLSLGIMANLPLET